MERWVGKVAIVTGASSGIGAAIAVDLALAGMKTIGFARRQERVDALKAKVPAGSKGELHSYKCDVSNEAEVLAAFAWVIKEFGGVDVLINNAGIVRPGKIIGATDTPGLRETIETNVMGVVYCSREAFASMKSRGIDGHIVLINSIAGHKVPTIPGMSLNIYPPTKHAVTAMTEVLRQELLAEGTKIKVTSISPGGVRTEIVPQAILDSMPDMPILEAEDISQAVLYVLGTPPRVQIHELTIKPVGELF